jgi:transketolase
MDYDGPMIIRIDRAGSPNVYADNDYDLEIGKAIELLEGTDAYVISCGSNLYECMMAAKQAKEELGLSIGIIDMHTIKPLDTETIIRVAEKTGHVITVEDHSINGGLGGAVAETLCEAGWGGKFKKIGMPDEFAVLGSLEEIYHYYGIDRDGIIKVLKEWFAK